MIAETVSAARTSFPGMHVWVIDDASELPPRVVRTSWCSTTGCTNFRIAPEALLARRCAQHAYRIVSDHVGADVQDHHRTVVGVWT